MNTQLTNKGKAFNPFKKLITGIVLFSIASFAYTSVGEVDGWNAFSKKYIVEGLSFLPFKLTDGIIQPILTIVLGYYVLNFWVRGVFKITTFYTFIPMFEDYTPGGVQVVGCDSYPNINRVLSYRESKMCGMSSDRAADLYIGSSKLDLHTGYVNVSGSETQRTLSYIESKLSGMSSDKGLDYLSKKS